MGRQLSKGGISVFESKNSQVVTDQQKQTLVDYIEQQSQSSKAGA